MADIGTLPPEVALEQQRLTRQQQMAQALMQNNQQPQGQMIGNRFVAPSFFQNLQPVANMLAGAYITNQAEEKQLALANKLREKENIAIGKTIAEEIAQDVRIAFKAFDAALASQKNES